MNAADVLEVAREAVVVMLIVGSPVLLLALFVTFVPKALVIFVSMLVFMPFMLRTLITFTEGLMDRIVALG